MAGTEVLTDYSEENNIPEVVEREPHNVEDMKRKLNLSKLKRV